MAPVVAVFYHEPRLVWVSIVLATSFIFNGAGVQHTALLERQMRFTALATIATFRNRRVYWLDLGSKTRSRDGSPLTEEVALFLGRYGVRLVRDASE